LKVLRKYLKAFELGFQNALEYRVNFLLSVTSMIFPMTIQFFLWTCVFSNSTNQTVYGYTYEQMITYTILAALVTKMISTGFEWEVAGDVKNGGLNKYIIMPIGYFQYRISCFFGAKIAHLGMVGLLIALFLGIISRYLGLQVEAIRVVLFILSGILSIILNYTLVFCISTASFWLDEVWGVFIAVGLTFNMLSGGLFPLEVFGEALQRVFDLLPFKYTISFPINIINGKLGFDLIWTGYLVQLVWIGILTLVSALLWRSGTKKYIAVGG